MAKNYFPAQPGGRRTSMQMRRKDQDASGQGTKWHCSLCQISYYDEGNPPKCPLCEAYRDAMDLRRQLAEAEGTIVTLTREVERATGNNDFVVSLRNAFELIGPDDLVWLKSVMYRWRESKKLTLKVIETRQGPRGLLAEWPNGTTEQIMFTSIGGVAIAGLFQEITHSFGAQVALMTLAKSMSGILRGGT